MADCSQIAFAKCHIEWARKNKAAWEEAKGEIQNVQAAGDGQ
jgi:sorting nexin-41/42